MNNIDIKEKFFNIFEIEPKVEEFYIGLQINGENCCKFCKKEKCDISWTSSCNEVFLIYPEITAENLLEMICICNSTYINGYTNYFTATGKTKEELKEEILKKCIALSEDIKSEIQQLFKD